MALKGPPTLVPGLGSKVSMMARPAVHPQQDARLALLAGPTVAAAQACQRGMARLNKPPNPPAEQSAVGRNSPSGQGSGAGGWHATFHISHCEAVLLNGCSGTRSNSAGPNRCSRRLVRARVAAGLRGQLLKRRFGGPGLEGFDVQRAVGIVLRRVPARRQNRPRCGA